MSCGHCDILFIINLSDEYVVVTISAIVMAIPIRIGVGCGRYIDSIVVDISISNADIKIVRCVIIILWVMGNRVSIPRLYYSWRNSSNSIPELVTLSIELSGNTKSSFGREDIDFPEYSRIVDRASP